MRNVNRTRAGLGGLAALALLLGAQTAGASPTACSSGAPCPHVAAKLLRAHERSLAPARGASSTARTRARARQASGTLLAPCDDPAGALCGSIDVPLDRAHPAAGTIPIFFAVLPHTAPGPAQGTILASEGGPGSSSTASPLFPFLFGALLDHRDLLTVDLRGTGRSAAIDCDALQHATEPLRDAVRACGAQLGPASSEFGSGDRADDIDDVRAALGIAKLDYYGLSGGGLQVQAYAVRHGAHLRTVILDAPYRAGFDDAFQSPAASALVREAQLVCERSPSCHAADPDPRRTLLRLLAAVRRNPVHGTAVDADGQPHHVVVDEARVINLLADSSGGFLDASEISAAARALAVGDAEPLLRMAAETDFPLFFDSGDPRDYSFGDFFATLCRDLTWPFDVRAPEATRRAQYDAAVAALPTSAFEPFSVSGWLGSFVPIGDGCVPWPSPTGGQPAIPPGARFPDVPALVLTGDLDTVVPSQNARAVARQFPHAQVVSVANAGHVAAPTSDCTIGLVTRFIQTAAPVDASCASRFTPSYGVGSFPRQARDAAAPPLDPRGRDRATALARRVAAVGWAGAYDAIQRTFRMAGDTGDGLRGGTFGLGGTESTLDVTYHGVRFTSDVAVDGTAHVDFDTGQVTANLVIDGPGDQDGTLRIAGALFPHTAPIAAHGVIDRRPVAILVPTA
jgi:pimeloyl-ACP methyl ester carboxylesterase